MKYNFERTLKGLTTEQLKTKKDNLQEEAVRLWDLYYILEESQLLSDYQRVERNIAKIEKRL